MRRSARALSFAGNDAVEHTRHRVYTKAVLLTSSGHAAPTPMHTVPRHAHTQGPTCRRHQWYAFLYSRTVLLYLTRPGRLTRLPGSYGPARSDGPDRRTVHCISDRGIVRCPDYDRTFRPLIPILAPRPLRCCSLRRPGALRCTLSVADDLSVSSELRRHRTGCSGPSGAAVDAGRPAHDLRRANHRVGAPRISWPWTWCPGRRGADHRRRRPGAARRAPGRWRSRGTTGHPTVGPLLLYTRSQRVWRQNTKGVYFLYSLDDGSLRPDLDRRSAGRCSRSSLRTARSVGFVRENNLYVVDVATGVETAADTRTAATWSSTVPSTGCTKRSWVCATGGGGAPTAARIAFWRSRPDADQAVLHDRRHRSSTREPIPIPYPKAGEPNSLSAEIGVVDGGLGRDAVDGHRRQPGHVSRAHGVGAVVGRAGDPADEPSPEPDRRAAYGRGVRARPQTLFTETSETWVDVDEDLVLGRTTISFLWTSDRDGFQSHLPVRA